MLRLVRTSLSLLSPGARFRYAVFIAFRLSIQALDALGLLAVALLASTLNGNAALGGFALSEQLRRLIEENLLEFALLTGLLFLIKSAISTVTLALLSAFLGRIEFQKSAEVLDYILRKEIAWIRKLSPARQQWLLGQSTQSAFPVVLFSFSTLLSEGFLLVVIVSTFFFIDSTGSIFLSAYFFVIVLAFQLLVQKRLRELGEGFKSAEIGWIRASNALHEGADQLVALNSFAFVRSAFDHWRALASKLWAQQRFLLAAPRFFVEAALMIGFGLLLVWLLSGSSSTQSLVSASVFLVGGFRLMAALLPLQHALGEMRIFGAHARDAQRFLRRELGKEGPVAISKTNQLEPKSPEHAPIVRVEHLSFRHKGSKANLLDNLSVEIPAGTFLGVSGNSGAGKSTFLEILLGLLEPDEGSVEIDGYLPREARQKRVGFFGYVPQKPVIFSGSLLENIALQAQDEIDQARAVRLVESLGLSELLHIKEETSAQERLGPIESQFSVGQRQRIGIARALYARPRFLLLDEPVSALDKTNELRVLDAISKIRGETTIVAVSHQESILELADAVIHFGHKRPSR